MRRALLSITACALLCGCGEDPARSVKIERPASGANSSAAANPGGTPPTPVRKMPPPATPESVTVSTSPAPSAGADSKWVGDICQAPDSKEDAGAETAEGGEFKTEGPCAIHRRQPVSCESALDDFYASFTRGGAGKPSLVLYFNVEHYHGPGEYDGTEMFLAVQSDKSIFRWSNDNAHVTVGPGEKFIRLAQTRLAPEPMLLNCEHLMDPKNSFQYQCSNRTIDRTLESELETVSGTLACQARRGQ